jgi:hypothetical protein
MNSINILDAYTNNPFFIIELKKNQKMKIEINKLHKISINIVKRKKIEMAVILMVLLISDLTYVEVVKFKIGIALGLLFLFVGIYTFYNKRYTLVIELKNKEKLRYPIAMRNKMKIKEKVFHIRDLQFKQNFKH